MTEKCKSTKNTKLNYFIHKIVPYINESPLYKKSKKKMVIVFQEYIQSPKTPQHGSLF